jgi:hypothetical protein
MGDYDVEMGDYEVEMGDYEVALNPRKVVQFREECRSLRCYAVWFLQEPHGVTTQKTTLCIVTAVKTSNLT